MVNDDDRLKWVREWTSKGNQWPRRTVRMVPKRAVPKAAPMLRKKLMADVAAPMSSRGTEFWTARTRSCMTMPMPRPKTTM